MKRSACVLLCLLGSAAIGAAEKPNIVLIMADDVGCETLGCYGGTSYETPRIDRLAESGLRFRHCYSMPVCHPTRVCLLTGRYPFRLGNPRWGTFPRDAERQTIAHTMRDAGYATAIAGKWQLTLLKRDPAHPHRLGFDEYSLFGWHEGPRYYEPLIWQNGKPRDDVAGRYGPDVYVDFLIDFIQRNQSRPFFAFYSMALCHDVTDDLKQPVPFAPGKDRYDSYGEMIAQMDRCAGRLVEALDRLDLRKETLVIFTADNGTSKSYISGLKNGKLARRPVVSKLGGRNVPGGKGELTNGGTNVPLIASWPGRIEKEQVVDDLVDFSDYFPTFAEVGAAALPRNVALDGHSFAARLRGEIGKARPWAYAEGRGKYWVRDKRWKLYNDGRLFDVKSDPTEKSAIHWAVSDPGALAARKRLSAALKTVQRPAAKAK